MAAGSDERVWAVGPTTDEAGNIVSDEVDEELLAHELLKLVGILQRLGGGVSIIARRREVADGIYITERVDIGWKPHAPLPRRSRPQPVPEVSVEGSGFGEPDEPEVETAAVSG